MRRVAAVVLAAGSASRYRAAGGDLPTKLVEPFAGEPMVRRPVQAARAAGLDPVLVVTGYAQDAVAAALQGLPVTLVHNPDYATGLASSLRTGLLALPPGVDAALVLLADMPLVEAPIIAALLAAAGPEADAVVPTAGGRRGNPVLLSRRLFAAASALSGDEGARRLLRAPDLHVVEVAVAGEAVRLDLDLPGRPPG